MYRYKIDVHKLGYGDVFELVGKLIEYNPETLLIDCVSEDIIFNFYGDEFDKICVEEFLNGYTDISWECDDD